MGFGLGDSATSSLFIKPYIQFVKNITFVLILIFMFSSCKGTGSSYRPIVDRTGDSYEEDLAQCQELSKQRKYFNADNLIGMAIGTAAGLAIGGSESTGAALTGAAIGGSVMGGSGAMNVKDERKYVIIRCLQGRGYKVIL